MSGKAILRQHYALILSLGGYFGWLLSFALFGPALDANLHATPLGGAYLTSFFLPAHALSLLALGLLLQKSSFGYRTTFRSAVLLTALLSVLMIWAAPSLGVFLMLLLGVVSAIPVLGFAPVLAWGVAPAVRTRCIALSMALANVLLYASTRLALSLPGQPAALLAACFLLMPALLFPGCDPPAKRQTSVGAIKVLPWEFIALVLIMYLIGGLAYQIVYTPMTDYAASIYLGVLPYVVASIVLASTVDLFGYRVLAPYALSFMGAAIVLFPTTDAVFGSVLTHVLMQAGYAAADLFLWTSLAEISSRSAKPFATFGLGLSVNLCALFLGLMAYSHWLGLHSLPRLSVAMAGAFCLFAGVPLCSRLHFERPEQDQAQVELPAFDQQILAEYDLTPRQQQISLLLLQGLTNEDISLSLGISLNTVKTHLRNVYARTGTKNRKDLMSLMLKRAGVSPDETC